jgi:hypothetical protein
MREQGHAAAPAPDRLHHVGQATQHGGIEHQRGLRATAEQVGQQPVQGSTWRHAATEHHRVRLPDGVDRRARGDPRLGQGDCDRHRDHVLGRNLELAGAGPHRRHAGENGRTRHFAAAADDQDPAAILLVAILGKMRKREAPEQIRVEPGGLAHRVATMASGSEVTGAASSINGAAKL